VICHIPFLLPPVTGSVPEKGSVSLGSMLGQCGGDPSLVPSRNDSKSSEWFVTSG